MLMARGEVFSGLDKKRTVIILQWLIAIVTSYLMLFGGGEISEDPKVHGLVAVLLGSGLLLYRLPGEIFHHPYFDTSLLLADTLLISASIYMNRSVSWDLFLLYFFVLLLAGIGTNVLRIVTGSLLISALYLGLMLERGSGFAAVSANLVLRVPFLFGVSILYGYLAENANRERHRAEMAEQRERLKMDLVSSLAHDIKNPLGIIMGYAEDLKDLACKHGGENAYVEPLQRIQENVQRIVNLVTGFLAASKAEAGKLEISRRPVSVNDLVREVTRQQEPQLARKRLDLELKLDEKLPEILGDETQLDRLFWNLIGNAIKFTPPGGRITVSSRRDDSYVCVAVQDTGMGIPREELPHLFTQFRRLKGAAKMEGTGLGLFIVKTIVEAHKGTVHVESDGCSGATFTVKLPIHR